MVFETTGCEMASRSAALAIMVVSPLVPAKSVPEFIDYAKANPGKVNMASLGTGSAGHVFGELFKIMTGVQMVHVPYRASWVPDLLSGQVQVVFSTIGAVIEHIRTGKLRALAVTAATRLDVRSEERRVGKGD